MYLNSARRGRRAQRSLTVNLLARRGRSLILVAFLTALSACIDDSPPSIARVVVEASPAAPLTLVVSTNFLITYNNDEEQTRNAVPLQADTTMITGDFDQEYSIAQLARLYVHLRNDEATPEPVRLRIYLDGDLDHDASAQLADGQHVQYIFTSVIYN